MTDLGKVLGAVQLTRSEAAREAALAASQRKPNPGAIVSGGFGRDGGQGAPIERSIPDPVFLKPLPMPHGAAATKALLDLDGQTPGPMPRKVNAEEAAQAYVKRAMPGHDRVSFLSEPQAGAKSGAGIKVSA